jgi:predicted TIM-barrel fold metal-dependent hydrolase
MDPKLKIGGIIDTLVGYPMADSRRENAVYLAQAKDNESRNFLHPAGYMFKPDILPPPLAKGQDKVAALVQEMDRWDVEIGLVHVEDDESAAHVLANPNRLVGCYFCDANQVMQSVRDIGKYAAQGAIRAVSVFPAGLMPQVAINDKKMYPVYAKCVELGLPMFCAAGVPGPRVPTACQHVELIDEVMYDFPELVFVTRHGCEPWVDLMVKLMVKWPNLHFSTSGFAPKYYPEAVVRYANTRGADRFVYGGYFAFGLTLERIMRELPQLPLKPEIWPKFLRGNALRILKLDGANPR